MSKTLKEKAKDLVSQLQDLAEMKPEVINMTSELPEGSYTLDDGTTFDIDADGNLVNKVDPTPEEKDAAEAVADAVKEAEDLAMAAQKEAETKLADAETKIAELEAKIVELSKTPKLPTGKVAMSKKKIEITKGMSYAQRVEARIINSLN